MLYDHSMRMSGVQVRHGYTEHMPERESWAKESYEIATKIAYRNGGRIGIPCTVATAPALPVGFVVSASQIVIGDNSVGI